MHNKSQLFYQMFWSRDLDNLVVTILDVTNPTYNVCRLYMDRESVSIVLFLFQIAEPKYLKELLPLKIEFTGGNDKFRLGPQAYGTFSFHM